MVIKKTSFLAVSVVAFAFSTAVHSQLSTDAPKTDQHAEMHENCPMMQMGMMGGMGMHGGQGMRGMQGMKGTHFTPGYEKLEMQMHAEMMASMAEIMKKYSAKLPDKR